MTRLLICIALTGCGGGTANHVDASVPPADAAVADAPPDADVPNLTVLAGQLGGFGNVDGTGATARFQFARGMASDGAGTLYVADGGNTTIRQVVLATGRVTTLAGSPGQDGAVDGVGAAARFEAPYGLVLDGGDLYITDAYNHAIRKLVIATGQVTTIAGTLGASGSADGIGVAASFDLPYGMTTDGAGNLYICDEFNATIRKLVIATGEVTTLAGTPGVKGWADGTGAAAVFKNPIGITSDRAGHLFVAELGNHTIREIAIATAVVTTIAGTAGMPGSADGVGAAARFSQPFDVASDGVGDLYVGDLGNRTVRKLVIATGVVTTVAGTPGQSGSVDGIGAAARFTSASELASDGAGALYISDNNNDPNTSTIRKLVLATGAVTTLAGTAGAPGSADGSAARFYQPFGIASDGTSLYVSDNGNDTIRKIAIAGGAVTTFAGAAGVAGSTDDTGTAARLNAPAGMASDGAGNLYLADMGNRTIRKLVIATGAVTTLAGTAGVSGSADGTGPAAQFAGAFAVAYDAGNLYIADTYNNAIRKLVIATGVVTTFAGSATATGSDDGIGIAARFSLPFGIASDGAGNLYVADLGNHTIRKIVIATAAVSTFLGTAGVAGSVDGVGAAALFDSPVTLGFDGAGKLYVGDASTVREVVLATGAVTTAVGRAGQIGTVPGPLPATLNCAQGVQPLGSDLAIVDGCENAVLIAHRF